ncbi:class I SAM-dependent methyltransferase [Radiobacillus deserti]|uniref:Class I SAM-dependent methyltransferase n=1 Tax=Radiobacillus deserti TaxID=2594883 RepID=A0A516KKA8_9BACI|nr:class I SAM-dependent methyltransferase [Radiobacillus deserti]QDP41833.1 class I SAM-dependent methyltransferase [Radiobacillus deserti]
MELSPILYHRIIRPKWLSRFYIHNRIEKFLKLDDKHVLDFGAGTGVNCTLCCPEKYQGIDPDVKRIEYAKKLYPDYVFNVFDNDKLTKQENSVDVVLIIAVLHHIPPEKIREYAIQFKAVLKPGGMVVAIEPCLFDKKHISNWYMQTADNGSYIQNERGYHDYFEQAGFTCKTIQRFKKCFLYNELFFVAY